MIVNHENENLIKAFCRAWNNLDISFIENQFCDDLEYSSQMVLANINGKDAYQDYLKAKFKAIKEGKDSVKAELGYFGDEPCLILVQTLETPEPAPYSKRTIMSDGTINKSAVYLSERKAVILFKFENNKIKSASMCMIAPNISDVKRTGIYPK